MSFYLGSEPVPQAILRKESTTLTAGQTVISTGGYTDGDLIQVSLNGVILEGSGVDYTATNGNDITLTVAGSAGDVLQFQTFDAFELVGSKFSAPTITNDVTLKNDTEEDTDGGRSSKLVYKGEQSGGQESTLAEIQASHDGSANDQKGDLIFRTNDGSDNAAPTEAARIDSGQNFLVSTTGVDPHNASSASDAGVAVRSDGRILSGVNEDNAAVFNRIGNNGDIITVKKDGAIQGTIGAENGDLNIDGPSGHSGIRFQASSILPRYNNADANGNMDLGYDDGTNTHRWRNLYLSGGINFGLASGTNVSSETLDDYEEGAWTPVLQGSSTAGTASGNTAGRYTKLGHQVFIEFRIDNVTLSGAAGAIKITGLPFTASYGTYNTYSIATVTQMHNFTFTTAHRQSFYPASGGNHLLGLESVSGSNWLDWNVSNTSGLYMNVNMFYITTQ